MNDTQKVFLEKAQRMVAELEKELIEIVRTECKTYEEANIFLLKIKREMKWSNNYVITDIIREVEFEFEKEKDGLSLK
ncbi:hypothetical protein SAMN05421743_12173 [Thalassobacillus cyri]|uniref:Uncharacterized protein n=1 Tax=Thalassobacillus cyri TaxID=571932 RepID=A0A1H4H2C1_9BACI|nr:hypothetical protein [Thalassobacillus cyri]SEB15985.1 hypothetical protein SAMN05421743_12173 [Thalassobacillus cyri]